MLKLVRRTWKYLASMLSGRFDDLADPKVQLEQAMVDGQEQHRRLVEQAANVIANQKQTEMRLGRAMAELEKLNGLARQALLTADEAGRSGDSAKVVEYTQVAETFVNRLIGVEQDVESLKQLHLQATQAADQAKGAVAQNAAALQHKLSERQRLLSQLDQAKMQEQVNRAMASLNESVGQDVPTLEEVREKIEARYARALGTAELAEHSVEQQMLRLEQAHLTAQAQARLAQMRGQLGLKAPGGAPLEPGPPAPSESDA
jgi:phage shock protein A